MTKAKAIDFDSLDTAAACENPYEFELVHPVSKDTLGVFSGLVAFVVGPLGLWFILTYPALRSVWQLGPQASRKT